MNPLAVVNIRGLVIALIVVFLAAAFAYVVCTYLAKRPDVGRIGAALIAVLGALLVLVDYTGN